MKKYAELWILFFQWGENEGGLKKIFEVEKAENSRIIAGMVYIKRRLL